ncbi:MAG TPA: FkbM family methyltransferase, partial [Candidatus Acidoferrum sp.]|nr:FkbM family methyltransferase [Candidatus Acidoferrum sp.]
PGTATLYGLDFGSRFASLHPRRDSYLSGLALRQSTVRVVTIDEVMDNLEIAVVDFMKLDIEGNELAALRGARRVLESKRIRALTFEFGSGNINSRTYFRDFWDLLQPLGYTVERIGPSGILIPVSAYYEDLEYFRGVTNYLAVLKGWPQDPSPALADTSRDA